MKHFKGIIATSHVDAHNEVMPVETLETMVEQVNRQYIPMGIEHDPRIPPQGRLVSAKVVKLEDGEYGVEGIGEIFEPEDSYELKDDGREIPLHRQDDSSLHIQFDRNYRDQDDQTIINELGLIFGTEPQEEIKKSLDPISILTIGGAFVLGGIANGFLGKIGSDAYDSIKSRLSRLLRKKTQEKNHESLLIFRFWVSFEEHCIEVETILTNPMYEDIDAFFESGIRQLDPLVSQYFDSKAELRRMTAEYKNNELKLMFGVRKDGVPMFPNEDRNTKI